SQKGRAAWVTQMSGATCETALHRQGMRLPELICGFTRERSKAPTLYPVACSPQSWAVGAVFLLLQACLGMRIYGDKRLIVFTNPVLPPFLDHVTLSNLRVGNDTVIVHVRRDHSGIDAVLLGPSRGVKIEIREQPIQAFSQG